MKRLELSHKSAEKMARGEPPIADLIMDSGAFSAWKLGQPVNLKEYTKFLDANKAWITAGVGLDVIKPGYPEDGAKEGYANWNYMRRKGVVGIPVVHVGEDLSWIDRYLDAGSNYIGLSASSIVSRGQADDWYALAWGRLTDSRGRPIVRAHAFGEGRTDSLLRFPWYSSDTTTWIYSGQRAGTLQFGDRQRLSFRNDGGSPKGAPDIARLDKHNNTEMLAILKELGILPKALKMRGTITAFLVRSYISALNYVALEKRVSATCPILFNEHAGFLPPVAQSRPGIDIPRFKLHMVIGDNKHAAVCLAKAEHPRVLASYFYVKAEKHYNRLRDYTYNPRATVNSHPYKQLWDLLAEVTTP